MSLATSTNELADYLDEFLHTFLPIDAVAATGMFLVGAPGAMGAGKVMVVNFWATSCVVCLHEMPQMVATHRRFRARGYEMLAVAMSYDAPMYVMNFSQTRQLPFKVAMDADGSAAKAFGDVQLTPTTFLVDRDGRILKRYVGEPEWSSFDALLKQTLGKQA